MHKFYYKERVESLAASLHRKYGWILWTIIAVTYLLNPDTANSLRFFFVIIALVNIILWFPFKKQVKPYILLDEEGIATVLPHGQETTQLLWKDVKKVFYSTNGDLCFYHGSDFTFYIALRSLSEEDKKAVIDIIKQKLDSSVMGLDKL